VELKSSRERSEKEVTYLLSPKETMTSPGPPKNSIESFRDCNKDLPSTLCLV